MEKPKGTKMKGFEMRDVIIFLVPTVIVIITGCAPSQSGSEDVCYGNAGLPSVDNVTGGSADNLFDDDLSKFWEENTGSFPHWAKYTFRTAKKIVRYVLYADPLEPGRMPMTWTFEASTTGVFRGEQVELDMRTDQAGWGAKERREFTFVNTTPFRYYRLNISAGNNQILRLAEIEMMESLGTSIR